MARDQRRLPAIVPADASRLYRSMVHDRPLTMSKHIFVPLLVALAVGLQLAANFWIRALGPPTTTKRVAAGTPCRSSSTFSG